MIARIIDGKKMALELLEDLKYQVSDLRDKGIVPSLKIIRFGENAEIDLYVRNKVKRATNIGIDVEVLHFAESMQKEEIRKIVSDLNNDPKVHAMLIQAPLPKHLNPREIFNFISPEKDVDCFTDVNLGKLFAGDLNLMPCTPRGILTMLQREKIDLIGMKALMIGSSNIVGNPMAQVLLRQHCTVTLAHSKTKNLNELCMQNDLILVAVGKVNLVNMVKEGAVVIDIGMNHFPEKKRIVGDCNFDALLPVASAITPVPGGVGPMTVFSVLQSTVDLCKRINNL